MCEITEWDLPEDNDDDEINNHDEGDDNDD